MAHEFHLDTEARNLLCEITTISSNPKRIPKKYRFTVANNLQNECMTLVRHITLANQTYPNTPTKLERRRTHQDNAITSCELLLTFLDFAQSSVPTIGMDTTERLTKKIVDIKRRLITWQKSDKLR